MGINMSYCMFENTVRALEEVLEKMWEQDFDPDSLSSHERRAYNQLYEMGSSIHAAIDEIEERKYDEELAKLDKEDDE